MQFLKGVVPSISVLNKIRQALLTVTDDVYHYETHEKPDKYIVWQEDGEGENSYSDDVSTYQTITGTIDYFTKTEDDLTVDAIQVALNNGDIVWNLNSVQYEKDTGYTHYEWEWEVAV